MYMSARINDDSFLPNNIKENPIFMYPYIKFYINLKLTCLMTSGLSPSGASTDRNQHVPADPCFTSYPVLDPVKSLGELAKS